MTEKDMLEEGITEPGAWAEGLQRSRSQVEQEVSAGPVVGLLRQPIGSSQGAAVGQLGFQRMVLAGQSRGR